MLLQFNLRVMNHNIFDNVWKTVINTERLKKPDTEFLFL